MKTLSEDKLYYLGWQLLLPGSARQIWRLVKRLGSPQKAWFASESELISEGGLKPETAAQLVKQRAALELENELARLEENQITYLLYHEPAYPELLRPIFDPPPGIFVRGALLPEDNLAVSIVGSRQPTPYGLAVSEKLGRELAQAGITVISGMARGIDTAAHKGALQAGGRTIGVLGCGVDVIYPRENHRLYTQIISAGAVISEFPCGSPPEAWHFPVRNRLISGLARALVVVEAREKSGALITADLALEQGREVMAVPGNITSDLSRGTNNLIKQGACLVEGGKDILEEIGLGTLFNLPAAPAVHLALTPEEDKVYQLLSYELVSLDELIEKTRLATPQVLSALMFLELKGFVKQFPGKFYTRRDINSKKG